jgi:hypothetical protein
MNEWHERKERRAKMVLKEVKVVETMGKRARK